MSPPHPVDVLPAEIGFSPTGTPAVAFSAQDEDDAARTTAFATVGLPSGRLARPQRVPRSQEILDLAFDGPTVELLTGDSPAGQLCCSSARVLSLTNGTFGRSRTVLRDLSGAMLGRLVQLPSAQLLAAIATDSGVWAAQARGTQQFGPIHRLTAPGSVPASLVATSLRGGRSFVAWTASEGQAGTSGPRSIFVAQGSRAGAPRTGRSAISVPQSHVIDELGLAPGGSVPTVAWIESWLDDRGAYQSQAVVANVGRAAHPRVLSLPGEVASQLMFAGDQAGDEALAWKVCGPSGSCTVRAAVRRAGERFGLPQPLGPVDPSQPPAVAVGPSGEALLGWIGYGHVFVADRRPGARRFGAIRQISRTDLAADLSLEFGQTGEAIAAWTQGTLAPSVDGAIYKAR